MISYCSRDVRKEFQAKPGEQPRPYSINNQGYLPNGQASQGVHAAPGAQPLLPNQGRVIQSGPVRVLCVADVRGKQASMKLQKSSS